MDAELQSRLRRALRLWVAARVELIDDATGRMDASFDEFDGAMFALGELVGSLADDDTGEEEPARVVEGPDR